ncbi:hypothetical protein GW17_00037418 [Ensete ventricosum]|nr:hypothetical protein GW17_00037418 [Ensete ventricosum]
MQWELVGRLVERLPKVSEAYQESLLGVRWELAEGVRELARVALGVRRKKTKRLVGRLSGFTEKLIVSYEDLD